MAIAPRGWIAEVVAFVDDDEATTHLGQAAAAHALVRPHNHAHAEPSRNALPLGQQRSGHETGRGVAAVEYGCDRQADIGLAGPYRIRE
jgi:hypothetical protein